MQIANFTNFSKEIIEFRWQLQELLCFLSSRSPAGHSRFIPLPLVWGVGAILAYPKSRIPTCILPSLLHTCLPAQSPSAGDSSCRAVGWGKSSFRPGGSPENAVGAGGFMVAQMSCCALWEDLVLMKLVTTVSLAVPWSVLPLGSWWMAVGEEPWLCAAGARRANAGVWRRGQMAESSM